MLKYLFNRLKRCVVWLQLYSVDLEIEGKREAMCNATDPELMYRIAIARGHLQAEQTRLRAQYNATLPPGVRRTWAY